MLIQSVRRSSPAKAKRSCPLPADAAVGSSVPAIVCQPATGSTGRNRRWPFTNSCAKFHSPRGTVGSRAIHWPLPSSAGSQAWITRPPLITGRPPAAARTIVGDRSVPESSGPSTSVSGSS